MGAGCRRTAEKPIVAEHTHFFKQFPQQWQELLARSKGREQKGGL